MWDDGRDTRLDHPGARATVAEDIDNHGQIVGDVKEAAGRIRGFLRTRGAYTLVDGSSDCSVATCPGITSASVDELVERGMLTARYNTTRTRVKEEQT
jgi:hypothetical protein